MIPGQGGSGLPTTWRFGKVISRPESSLLFFGIHDVYYDDQGRVTTWTETAVAVTAETVDALKEELEIMAEALMKPVLKESELLEEVAQRKRLPD